MEFRGAGEGAFLHAKMASSVCVRGLLTGNCGRKPASTGHRQRSTRTKTNTRCLSRNQQCLSIPRSAPTLSLTYRRAASTCAYVVPEYGTCELVKDWNVANPKPHQVRVEVKATAVNPLDRMMYKGYGRNVFEPLRAFGQSGQHKPNELPNESTSTRPFVLGRECAGIIESVGSEVWDLKPGDEVVVAANPTKPATGTHALLANVSASDVAIKPDDLSFNDAGGFAFTALTAASVTEYAQPGQTALVHGGSGAVGAVAIELLREKGCRVIATCSAANIPLCIELGAHEALNYECLDQTDLTADISDVQFVLDAAPTGAVDSVAERRSLAIMRPGGHYVTLSGDLLRHTDDSGVLAGVFDATTHFVAKSADIFAAFQVRYHWGLMYSSQTRLQELCAMVKDGALHPELYPYSEVEFGHTASYNPYEEKGRIVLTSS